MRVKTLIVIYVLIASVLWAQEESIFKLNVNVDLTEVHVNVTDEKDRPVGNLNKEHFRVFENQSEQQLSVFKHEDLPISLGLVIDNSRSMEPRKQRLDDAARLDRDFTNSIPVLEETLAAVQPYGQTAIYDALILALDHMHYATRSKKAVLLMTDGVDNSSKHTLNEAIEATQHAHVAVYTVGLLSESGGQKAEDSLVRIAEASGGRAFFPITVDEARADMERVARDLREQYTLGYIPSNPSRQGQWRSVRVEVIPPRGTPRTTKLYANYRHGYYGPANKILVR